MSITVEVTQDDIRQGEKRNCYRCPIALAIRRVLKVDISVGSLCDVGVGPVYARFNDKKTPLPYAATSFVATLDRIPSRAT